jgi:uncharacterized protein YjbJ (UPF0337 family)
VKDLTSTVRRTAVTTTFGLARVPADLATRFLPGGDSGLRGRATSLVDRLDGSVRELAGRALHDPELQADGRRRALAARHRDQAGELRAAAGAKRAEADRRASRKVAEAEDRRDAARDAAAAEQAEAEEQRSERSAAQERAAAVRTQEVREQEAQRKAAASKQAKRERLRVLDDRAGALVAEEEALTAASEAERLADAATKAKRSRTSS